MAVEIPVVIDIDKAFVDAANRVKTAIKPLQAEIESSTAALKVNVSPAGAESDYRTLKSVLDTVRETIGGTNFALEHLENALTNVKARLNELTTIGLKRGTTAQISAETAELREAVVLLESEIDLRKRAGDAASVAAQKQIAVSRAIAEGEAALMREANTMAELSDRISALRGKLVNLDPSQNNAEWTATAKEISKATKELEKYQKAYKAIVNPPKREITSFGSIDRISRDMKKLEQQWNKMGAKMKFDPDGQLSAKAKQLVKDYQDLTAQSEKYGQSLASAAGKAKTSVSQTTTALKSQSAVLQQLTSYAKMYVSIFGLFRFVKQIRDVTAELEYQRVALGHLIQDEQYGAKLFEQIKAAAIESPFRITQLVTYTKQLAAYRIEQEKLFDTTRRLADISAGLGVDMNRLILAYGQVRAASVLRGQELRQFTEAGIPLVELLAEKFQELGREGTTTADVFKLISERAVPFSMIADIFEDLTDKGGMFYEMQKEQAKTLKGRWEKLKDTYDIALQSIGETKTFENWNNIILGGLKLLANNIRIIPKLLEAMTRGWLAYNAAVALSHIGTKKVIADEVLSAAANKASTASIGKLTIATIGEAKARDLLTKAYARQAVATNFLSKSFWRLTAAMLSNPIGAILGGVAALTAIFFSFRKSVNDTAGSLDYLDDAIEGISKANVEFEKSGKLIERYKNLASSTDLTAKKNQDLYTTIERLRDIYPELAEKIGDANIPLEEQVRLLGEAREERQKQARLEAEGSYETAKKDLEDALSRQQDLEAQYRTALQQQKNYEELGLKHSERVWRKKAEKIKESLEETRDNVGKLYSSIGDLEKYLFPEQAAEKLAEWQRQVRRIQEEKLKAGDTPVFTPEEIDNMTSVYDLFGKLKKRVKDLEESLDGMREALSNMTPGSYSAFQMDKDIKEVEKTYEAAKAIAEFFGFLFSKSGKNGYQQDPFINLMQDRIKFMQDFKKGYDDLREYMADSGALMEESRNMLSRGLSLGIDESQQKRAADDLSRWYEDAINEAFENAKKHGAKGTLQEFLSQQITDTTNQGKALRDFQKLIQSLWDAKTDFDTSQLKKSLEDSIKRLADEIKRSETVRNFYQNILDLTGDEELAASMSVSVYGGLGEEFKDRMQKQLDAAFASLDWTELPDDVWGQLSNAFVSKDFDAILEKINLFPKEWQKRLKEMAEAEEKHNADVANDLLKSLQQSKTYSEKRVELAMQTAKRIQQIEEMNVPESTKDQLRKQNAKKEAEEAAKLAYDAFKETPMYVELFANLDRASTSMLRNMRENLLAMKSEWKDLHPRELKELQSRLDELDRQLATKNPFRSMIESLREYFSLTKQMSRREADIEAVTASRNAEEQKKILEQRTTEYEVAVNTYGADSENARLAKQRMNAQKVITDQAIEEAEAAQDTANAYRLAAKHIEDAANALQDWAGYVSTSLDGIQKIFDVFASDDVADTFGIIANGVTQTLSGAAKTAGGVARILAGDLTAIPEVISGIGDLISGVFGTKQKLKIKDINKQIESQSRLVEDLEYSYGRLENAIANAFGSDYIYNYNKQLENLLATQEAYEKQANLEREKGKKADEEKIREYENSARDAADQIADMQGELAKYFAGTDLTSAAKDFANSWIEAYKEFGSTTDAMKERFQEMVQNMIEQSLGAKIMQSILQPLFDSIDQMAQTGGELSAQEIAQIGQMAPEYIDKINAAMTNLMTQLTANGYNIRQQMGGFTGISRDIAGASEESINGLAAGINTQNFYMSLISQNVASILMAMTGESVQGATGATEPDPYKETMLEYVGSIPQMRDDMNAIRTMLERVIRPIGTTSTHYVSVRM